jgi:hypothetical protein
LIFVLFFFIFKVDSEGMASATTHHQQLTVSISNTSAVQQQQQQKQSPKVAGSNPNQQALAALAGSPTSTSNGANCDPDVVRQLPEVIRHVLHGCVGTGSGYGTAERGAHLTVYVTSADPTGITRRRIFPFSAAYSSLIR